MKADNPAKHFLLAFLIALAGYVLCYETIQHWRTRNGPWQVTFLQAANRAPEISIQQPKLGITNVKIIFVDEIATNQPAAGAVPGSAATLSFRQPRPVPYDLPFGSCVFMDTISLPGTVTFQIFGHVIELLPRVLIIDRQEYPWRAEATINLP